MMSQVKQFFNFIWGLLTGLNIFYIFTPNAFDNGFVIIPMLFIIITIVFGGISVSGFFIENWDKA